MPQQSKHPYPVSPTRRAGSSAIKNTASPIATGCNSAVVAQLSQRKSSAAVGSSSSNPAHNQQQQHPYSAISLSPCRNYAVTAGKDVLQLIRLRPTGLQLLKTVPAALYFQHQPVRTAQTAAERSSSNMLSLSEFAFGGATAASKGSASAAAATPSSILAMVITDVAWSHGHVDQDDNDNNYRDSSVQNLLQSSRIAAAGSNGVIVVWSAAVLLEGTATAVGTNVAPAAPEAVFSQHVRAVNRLAWHPTLDGCLLSASQDGTVLLWERRSVAASEPTYQLQRQQQLQPPRSKFGFFGGFSGGGKSTGRYPHERSSAATSETSFQWICIATFAPKSEAVRDIRWSPYHSDVFAVVTASGSLIVYNRRLPYRAVTKLTAHSGEATCVDWHPRRPHILATGGASDRCVKVWDLASELDHTSSNGDSSQANQERNSNTLNTMTSRCESVATTDSSTGHESVVGHPTFSTNTSGLMHPATMITVNSRTLSSAQSSRHKSTPKYLQHVLSISASAMRLRWRPPANESFVLSSDADDEEDEDRHDSMLAVATAPIKGASAGGSGMLALWSCHRPYMPLSVVEGHKDGAVTDFEWLDTPLPPHPMRNRRGDREMRVRGSHHHETDAILYDNNAREYDDDDDQPVAIWQHVLSVGRDGRCLIQSFTRGDRPISRVPPSCFAMANLSPFQKGYGSLQFFSVCQSVPSGADSDFLLTGLRRDSVTATALGVFREMPTDASSAKKLMNEHSIPIDWKVGKRLPENSPEIVFNVVDQGDLDEESNPVVDGDNEAMIVAPEVVHLSRFATRYRLYRNDTFPTRVSLCQHNADAADSLRSKSLAHMWRMLASMLEISNLDRLPDRSVQEPQNVMQFVIIPTVQALLEERADAGDVQTCVALCEVLEIVRPDQTVRIPKLDINLIREWYLSYIDLLRDMCLFSDATYLIRNCKDPYIGALNQQSTTIHESCPHCGKALLDGGAGLDQNTLARRACKSCRRRVGLCFLCHEPVKGLYVWCPGCGHGGHLSHALQWFGGPSSGGGGVREVCPTGCGHKCNLVKELSAFPRTESMHENVLLGEFCEVIGVP